MKKMLALLLAALMLVSIVSCGAMPAQVEENAAPANDSVIASGELAEMAFKTRDGVAIYAEDNAYVRGGSHADKNFASEVAGTQQLILKTVTGTGDYDRSMLLKFDLS